MSGHGELTSAADVAKAPREWGLTVNRQQFDALFDLRGRVALVTGGTRGIGRSIAQGLALARADVVVASRKAEACDETASALRRLGGRAAGIPTHMGDLPAIARLVDQTVEQMGRLDIVVNNAATA